MFAGLKVVELASVLAGPSVGQFFAELGAEVIKVENLKTRGDVTRSWKISGEKEGDLSAYFCSCNWGKKSVALDLSERRGKEIVQKLVTRADVVIASYKPGDAEKLGVDFKTLSQRNPKLIYGQISGYGSDSDRVGYDAVIQAESGFMDMNGEADGPPVKMPVALIDILAGHQLKEALLLALLKKERTGQGSFVEVSLIQAALSSLANQGTNLLVAKKVPARKGSAHPNIAPYGEVFETKDGKKILLAVGNDKQFENLCQILSISLSSDFSTNQKRVNNREKLSEQLTEQIKKFESGDLMKGIHTAKIPAGIVQNVAEAFEMKAAKAVILKVGELSGLRNFIGGPAEWQQKDLLPPPHFGEHTEEILAGIL